MKINHGKKLEEMYPTMNPENKVIYPMITLPTSAFGVGKYQPGHKCTLEIEVEIKNMNENNYECELIESEEVEDEEETK